MVLFTVYVIYNVVSAKPENFGEMYSQLQADSDGFRWVSKSLLPADLEEEFEEIIEESKHWQKIEHGGYTPEGSGQEPEELICGGMRIRSLDPEERLERLGEELPQRLPVGVRELDPE